MIQGLMMASAIGLACMAMAATSASAAMVTYKVLNDTSLYQSFDLTIDGQTWTDSYAGGIKIEKQSGDPSMPQNFIGLCTDINGVLTLGATYGYDLKSFAGLTGIDPQWGSTAALANQAIQNAAHLFVSQNPGLAGSATAWAALQLAVWEALYDTGSTFDLTSGRFSVQGNSTTIAAAQEMLTQLAASIPAPGTYKGYLLSPNPVIPPGNGGYPTQGLLVTPVPEPATVIAGVFLMVPLGMSAVRYWRKKAAA
jgi:hypothetical protein